MAYDETTAQRVAAVLNELSPFPAQQRKMFGGIAYMIQGNMCIGVNQDSLMVRVREGRPCRRPFATGRSPHGFHGQAHERLRVRGAGGLRHAR